MDNGPTKTMSLSSAGCVSKLRVGPSGLATVIHIVQGSITFSVAVGPIFFDEHGHFDAKKMTFQRIHCTKGFTM